MAASRSSLPALARVGDSERVRLMLQENGVNVNEKESGGLAAIHHGALNGNQYLMTILVDHEGIELDAQDEFERTALIIACQKGHHGIVQLLLERGANVLITTKENFTCLHMATFYGHEDVVDILLHGKSPRSSWETRDSEYLPLLPLPDRSALLQHKSSPHKFTALHVVALGRHENSLSISISLLEACMSVALDLYDHIPALDPEKMSTKVEEKWYQDLLLEIRDIVNVAEEESDYAYRSLKFVKQSQEATLDSSKKPPAGIQALQNAFDELNSYVNAKDCRERTALHYAAWHNRWSMVEFLVWDFKQGRLSLGTVANVNATDQDGCTPLQLAAWRGHHLVVEALLVDARDGKRFKLPDLKFVADKFTITGLENGDKYHDCTTLQPNSVVKSNADFKGLRNSYEYGRLDTKESLPRPILQPFEERRGGLTPLLYAVERNHVRVVEWLLSHPKIDMFAESSYGETPWTMVLPEGKVCQEWNKDIPKLLRTGGSKFVEYKDESGYPPAYRYKQRLVQKAVSLAAANKKSTSFLTLEMQICLALVESFMKREDSLDQDLFPDISERRIVEKLLWRGAATFKSQAIVPKITTQLGDWERDRTQKPWKISLSHVTVYYDFHEELRKLLILPAFLDDDLNDREEITGRTALDLAVALCNTKAVKILLQEKEVLAAAEPGRDGRTPFEIAIDMQSADKLCDKSKAIADKLCDKSKAIADKLCDKSKAIERLLRVRPDVQRHIDELYRDRQVFVDAANAILVGAALIASVTFVGWLQPPLNYTLYYDEPAPYPAPPGTFKQFAAVEQHLSIRIFWAFNSLSFFSAIATVVAGAGTVLPTPGKSIYEEVQSVRIWLVFTLLLLLLSSLCVLGAFTAAGIAALPPITKYRNNMVVTSTLGMALCYLVLFFLSRKLFLTLKDFQKKKKKKLKWC